MSNNAGIAGNKSLQNATKWSIFSVNQPEYNNEALQLNHFYHAKNNLNVIIALDVLVVTLTQSYLIASSVLEVWTNPFSI